MIAVSTSASSGETSSLALHEVHLRGLLHTGRPGHAIASLNRSDPDKAATPPQWRVIMHVTRGEILTATGHPEHARTELCAAIPLAEQHRLPHQIQRAARAGLHLTEVTDMAANALARLWEAHA